jgi:chemotaxis family two-component system response regulator Rcp1
MTNAVEILLVEDNPADVKLTTVALQKLKIANQLRVVSDGQKAMEYLRKEGPFAGAPTPHLILLDLNLPKKNGHEVLADVKRDDNLKHIPVVILTSSDDREDIIRTYQQHANCYISKPVDLDGFMEIVKTFDDFWFTIVKLPNGK